MGSYTAQILIGRPHPNHGGIYPTHSLFLSENSRPGWILTSWEDIKDKKIWIPTMEFMLEDGLLMIAFYLLKDPEITLLFSKFAKKIREREPLYNLVTLEELRALHQECQKITKYPKLIISVFEGSTILYQVKQLEKYQMEVEVCLPNYYRLYSMWSQEFYTGGQLPEF
ncbi:hypothetical protein NIES2119_19380 [[Phormidium ambiguum] IAM M-71]|uniref:Uncharacterized protein n=1 Tax=[Phormidium ambiguum] IAM M-71 TaxID=454136 RepID=A0A1U7IFB1_9CYAN|nr:hypothetical protein [Phormidium ambiguum]OKH35667.1 hypothetical protein NIES2119_19380 [Phormidium ambiguum IAM M-71]